MLVLGVLQFVALGVRGAAWGSALIVIGLASFYFRSSAMLVVYGVAMVWVALSNALVGQTTWLVLQLFLAVLALTRFASFRKMEGNLSPDELAASGLRPGRAAKIFPWAAGALGVVALVGLLGMFSAGVLIGLVKGAQAVVPPILLRAEELVAAGAVLACAAALGSLLSTQPRRSGAVVGLATGGLTVLTEVILMLVM